MIMDFLRSGVSKVSPIGPVLLDQGVSMLKKNVVPVLDRWFKPIGGSISP